MDQQPVIIRTSVLATTQHLVALGRNMLDAAEAARSDPAKTFDPSPLEGDDPSADWAAAGLLIGRAMHHLDESIPSGQRNRTSAAMGALVIGCELLEAALSRRQTFPSRLILGAQQEAQQDPSKASPVFGLMKEYLERRAEVAVPLANGADTVDAG